MKKQKVLALVALVMAISVLTVTAFAASPEYEGYEAFKEIMKNHDEEKFESGTITGSFQLIDNGETLVEVAGVVTGDKEQKEMRSDITLVTKELQKNLAVLGMDGVCYIYDKDTEDVYFKEHDDDKMDEEYYERHDDDGTMSNEKEKLMDIIVGDLRDDFELNTLANGTSEITFELTKEEVPVALNLLISVAAKGHDRHDYYEENKMEEHFDVNEYPLFAQLKAAKIDIKELTEDIELDYIRYAVTLDENKEITGMEMTGTISGKDDEGKDHEMTIKADFQISNKNNTTIEPLDLEGKNLIELPECDASMKHRKMKHHRR